MNPENPAESFSPQSIADMDQASLQIYLRGKPAPVFMEEYLALDKPSQLKVYNNLNDNQKKLVWQAFEQKEKEKWNNLSKEEFKEKYLALSKEDQHKEYSKFNDAQKKQIWEIFEEEKKRKEEEANKEEESNPIIPNSSQNPTGKQAFTLENQRNTHKHEDEGDSEPLLGAKSMVQPEGDKNPAAPNVYPKANIIRPTHQQPFSGMPQPQRMAQPAQPQINLPKPNNGIEDNENDTVVCCLTCCGGCINFVCCPCCLATGGNRITIRQGEAGLMMKNGKATKNLPPGIYVYNTCLYKILVISLKNRVASQKRVPLLTSDNVSIFVDFYITYEILDPFSGSVGLAQLDNAVGTIANGRLKNLISGMKFQEILKSSEATNKSLKNVISDELQKFRMVVRSTEITSIILSNELTMSMAQVAISEKDRHAQVALSKGNIEVSKLTDKAASIMKENSNSINLHFFDTINNIAKKGTQVVVTADGMLSIPKN